MDAEQQRDTVTVDCLVGAGPSMLLHTTDPLAFPSLEASSGGTTPIRSTDRVKAKGEAREVEADSISDDDHAPTTFSTSTSSTSRTAPPTELGLPNHQVDAAFPQPRLVSGDILDSSHLAPVFPQSPSDHEHGGEGEGDRGDPAERRRSSLSGYAFRAYSRTSGKCIGQGDGYFDYGSRSGPILASRRSSNGSFDATDPSSTHASSSRLRPTHQRAKSSMASSNPYDFFGPSSIASAATAATSPCSSPLQIGPISNRAETAAAEARQDTVGDGGAAHDDEAAGEGWIRQGSSSRQAHELQQQMREATPGPGQQRFSYEPPYFEEEPLPNYEEAPAYTPSPEVEDYEFSHSTATSGFRSAAASRFLSGRLARRLHLSDAQRRGDGEAVRTNVSTTSYRGEARAHSRVPFTRSDSAPDITRLGRRRVEVHSFAATDFVQGAVMGPSPRRPHTPSLGPATSAGVSRDDLMASARASARFLNSNAGAFQGVFSAFSASRSAAAKGRTSPRPVSRPVSRADWHSGSTGGFFTCGYASNRSGASTPSRLRRGSKSRNLSIRDLSDLLFNRERRGGPPPNEANTSSAQSSPEAPLSEGQPSKPAEADLASAQVSSDDEEQEATTQAAVVARRKAPRVVGMERPSLMRAAYSSLYASVAIDAAAGPWLVSPGAASDPNYFAKLPRELVIFFLQALIELHADEHQRDVDAGTWRGAKTSGRRWVGAEEAVRELVRLGRVSRDWQSYVFDGQLWQTLDVSSFPEMSEACLLRIGRSAGPFVRKLDLGGLSGLPSASLRALFSICEADTSGHRRSTPWTSLVELNLQGCSGLTTGSLGHLLSHLSTLKRLDLSGLACVTDDTCKILADAAVDLEQLDISRCFNMTGTGLEELAKGRTSGSDRVADVEADRKTASPFRVLRATGVGPLSPGLLSTIGKQWPNLEELDFSHTDISNLCIASLVSSEGDPACHNNQHHVALTPWQAGIDSDGLVYRRTFPHLKKLKLGSCTWLNDAGLSHLAYAVPSLEVLELSHVGSNGARIRDAGLLSLLPTIPQLQKLDLEGASAITDGVLGALTPPASHAEAYGAAAPLEGATAAYEASRSRGVLRLQARSSSSGTMYERRHGYDKAAVAALIPATGTHLTHLMLSLAKQLSVAAIILLIQRCPKLRHLELDDTMAGDSVAREFVHLSRQRKIEDAYISLVDCRGLTHAANHELANLEGGDAGTRPRQGQRGWAFRQFLYDDADAAAIKNFSASVGVHNRSGEQEQQKQQQRAGASASSGAAERRDGTGAPPSTAALRAALGHDECNRDKVVLKNFYAWESVDARTKARRKAEAKEARRSKQQISSVVAMALSLGGGSGSSIAAGGGVGGASAAPSGDRTRASPRATDGERTGRSGRWSRILSPVDSDNDDNNDDPRGCTIA